MRIDEALSESKPLAVKFNGGVLNIEYRPPSYTIEEMVAADADKDNPERLIKMIQDLVVAWDLTRLAKVAIAPAVGNDFTESIVEQEVPVDVTNPEDVRRYVPQNIIMGIIKAVREDSNVSGE